MKRLAFILSTVPLYFFSQSSINYSKAGFNTKVSAVPFLLLSSDARAGGMGNCGAASSPDGNSIHWNAAKLAFIQKSFGMSFSYSPWYNYSTRSGVFQVYGSMYKKISKAGCLAASARYFELGSVQFTDKSGGNIGTYLPNESSFDLAYAQKLGNNFSGAITARYIYSNLTNRIPLPNGVSTHIAHGWAGDFSMYYSNHEIILSERKSEIGVGLNISNLGPYITYIEDNSPGFKDHLPTQARIGASLKTHFDDLHSLSLLSDLTRLIVPSLPYKDPESELSNLSEAVGLEYCYKNSFMLRTGYLRQDSAQNHRQYFTLGLGCRYKIINFDLAFLIPILHYYMPRNIIRLTLSANFLSLKSKEANKGESINPI